MLESRINRSSLTADPSVLSSGTGKLQLTSVNASCTFHGVFRLLAFFGIVAVLILGANAVINSGMRRIKTSSFGVSNKVVNGQINADIIITGSSRAMVHYDPRIIEKATGRTAFNLGLNGSQTDMQVAMLKTYLEHNAKPKLLIHNLDPFSFQVSHEIYDPAQYMPYLNQAPIYDSVRRVYPDAWKWKLLPLYGYLVEDMRFTWLKGLKGFLGKQPEEDRFQGFVPRHLSWTGDFDKFREHNPGGVSFEIEPAGVQSIEGLAKICRDRQIPLLFVYAPEFIQMQQIEKNREEIFGTIRDVCQRYHVPFWDYSDSPICLDGNYFYNSQHLNARGADRFSTDLSERLREYLARPQSLSQRTIYAK